MSEDERLREALLELQILRDREAQILNDTQTLLDCLEAYSGALTPDDALESIFTSLSNKIGSRVSLVAARSLNGLIKVKASDTGSLLGARLRPPVDLFSRSRNVLTLSALGDWEGPLAAEDYGGFIIAVMDENTALLSLLDKGSSYSKSDFDLVQRLAGLAAQSMINREINLEKDLLAATISGSSSGFAISDATKSDQPLVYVNKAFEQISGYSAEDVLGQNCRFLTAEAPDSPERTRLREAVENRTGGTFLLRNRRKSGELFWNELTLYPVRSTSKGLNSLVATQRDVSDRVEAAEQRDRARARMFRAFSASTDSFLVLEADQSVAVANTALIQLFPAPGLDWKVGTTFSENWAAYLEGCKDFPGRVSSLLVDPDLSVLANRPAGQEADLPDGRSVLIRASWLDDGGMVLAATDITAMKSAQHLLSQRLAAIEAAPSGIVVTDDGGRIVFLNPSAVRLLGFSTPTRGLGKKWWKAYKNGAAVEIGGAFEIRLGRKSTDAQITHEITCSPLDDGGSVLVIRDITENLALEAREAAMMQELARLQRQEAIAQLTAGIAHDFNNLLAAINGSATLIGMSGDLPHSVRPHIERISAAGVQSSKLISRLLDVGSSSDKDGAFDLSTILTTLPDLLGSNIPANVDFAVETEDLSSVLMGNAGIISQVLVNLVLNSRDAIGESAGRIQIWAEECKGIEATNLAYGHLDPAGLYCCIQIADSGCGMNSETLQKAFDPFFTTKGRQGTGLGLATSALQVQAIGGAVGVDTLPGTGTTFRIYWPLAIANRKPTIYGAGDPDLLRGKAVIVVDDDLKVAEVISSFLEGQGLEVAVCQDPLDALDAVAEDPTEWHALITDYDMPQMNGGELTERVHAIAPDLPVLVVTALAKRLSDPRLNHAKTIGILAKPLDLDDLSRTLTVAFSNR